jgi:hypothetical protein
LISISSSGPSRPGEVAQALRIDGGRLLDQHPDIGAEEFDGGMDHGAEGFGVRRVPARAGKVFRPSVQSAASRL